jgi:hypothetical protein
MESKYFLQISERLSDKIVTKRMSEPLIRNELKYIFWYTKVFSLFFFLSFSDYSSYPNVLFLVSSHCLLMFWIIFTTFPFSYPSLPFSLSLSFIIFLSLLSIIYKMHIFLFCRDFFPFLLYKGECTRRRGGEECRRRI